MSTKYDIYLDTGMNGIGAHYGVDKIVIHPSYNPSNFVNNIAIMEFNLDSEIAWQNKIAPVLDYEWDEIGLISGIPTDLNKLKWEGFIYNFTRFSTSSTCNKLSEMYEANSKDLLYFTSLANYIGFIKDTIKRDVLIDSLFQFDTSKLDIDYKMVDRDFKDNNGLASTKITGNFYGDHSF
ncbi:hypothetical protein IWW51_003130 [Coemansia sp. RSA 2702]|nr:hypothetical protein IWW51_003130 [Coemansia sp. RSA 2702]